MTFIIILLLYFLSSCSPDIDCVVDEIGVKSKSIAEPITIINDAKGVTVYIDSCSVSKEHSLLIEYGDVLTIEGDTQKEGMIYLYGTLYFGDMIAYKGQMIAPEKPIIVSCLCDSLGERILYIVSFDISIENWYN